MEESDTVPSRGSCRYKEWSGRGYFSHFIYVVVPGYETT